MRFINSVIAVVVAVLIILFAVSNRQAVVVEIWPLPYQLSLSLYAVILLAGVVGFFVGIVAQWLMGHEKRRELKRLRRQVGDLEESLARHQMLTGNARGDAR